MKNCKRHLIRARAVVLVLSVLPLSAFAYDTGIYRDILDTRDCLLNDDSHLVYTTPLGVVPSTEKGGYTVTIKDYDALLNFDDHLYDFIGMGSIFDPKLPKANNGITSITIPALPDDATLEEIILWQQCYTDISLVYAPHKHDLGPICYSPTNHWRECRICHEVIMDWHHDYNEDGVCDICGQDIVYYKVSVLDTQNGKVTVSKDKASLNQRVDVTVEPADGYVLQELHFYKLNSVRSELTRYEDVPGEKYHLTAPSYDVEIEAVFVKK